MQTYEIAEEYLSNETLQSLETVEQNAWSGLYKSASPETAKALGINYRSYEQAGASIISSSETLAFNRVLGLQDITSIHLLEDIKREYKSSGVKRFFLQLHPDTLTRHSLSLLRATGFCFYNNWVKLYRDAAPVKHIETDVITKKAMPWEPQLAAQLLINCFGWNSSLQPWLEEWANLKNWTFYIGRYNGIPVSVGGMYIEGEYAWLAFGATLKEYRELGAHKAMIERRLNDGIEAGCRHFIVETGETHTEKKVQSNKNIIEMGFNTVYIRPNFIFPIPNEKKSEFALQHNVLLSLL